MILKEPELMKRYDLNNSWILKVNLDFKKEGLK